VDIALTPLEFELDENAGEIACDMLGIQPEAKERVKRQAAKGRDNESFGAGSGRT